MAPPGRAEPQPKRPGEGAKERKLHGVRRERMKGRSSREGGSSRQSILMKKLKRRSELRRQLLARELGVASPQNIRFALCSRRELDENRRLLYKINPNKYRATPRYEDPLPSSSSSARSRDRRREYGRSAEDDEVAEILNVGGSESTYKDSNIFLKGTQSANPHNDYSQHFVDIGQRPQNFIRDVGMDERFKEYPKLKELIRLKDEQIERGATQPMYLKCDLRAFDLNSLGSKFDVILVDPPLEEYQRRASGITFNWSPLDWEDIMNLKLEDVAAQRSFVFLWCGSCEGLDIGRECLKKWGFRRCEDICWVKTNIKNPGKKQHIDQKSIFRNTKEHCLMGIKGTVRRNQDGHFIHANIDLDIIITEEPELGSVEKPEEIFHIIEHFCLGRRRLHLFGTDNTIRPGWLTLGPHLTSSNFSKELYSSFFEGPDGYLLSFSEEIETLRPKTPPMKSRGGGRGQGTGRGGGMAGGGMGRGSPMMSRGGMHGPGRTF